MSTLHILWDESHLWGLLAVRAVEAFGLPFRIVTAREVAEGTLRKNQAAMLLVPGGNARFKAHALGKAGLYAIQDYVANGGSYLGFCGGAGLALTWPGSSGSNPQSLGLCPWKRARFEERMQHFMSGHLHMALPHTQPDPYHTVTTPRAATIERVHLPASIATLIPQGLSAEPLLPVWWPGRFDPEPSDDISILATYKQPGPDFWLADLPIAGVPPHMFKAWEHLYGFSISPSFLEGQPCLIHGHFGKGSYALSYSHLETPDSPDANLWLAHLFTELAGLPPQSRLVPAWHMEQEQVLWDDPALATLEECISSVTEKGLEYGVLFRRNDWLLGWMSGIPGASLNSLLATVRVIRRHAPTPQAEVFWKNWQLKILQAAGLFAGAGVEYLLTERLAVTLSKTLPDALPPSLLKDKRAALFGPPMQAGGLFLELIEPLDRLACLQLGGQ